MPALREVLGQLRAARSASSASTRHGQPDRRACSSTGSPPTCTRVTRRWPSAGRPRLALDRDLLRDLLGAEELRELLDPGVLADVELELQCLTDGRRARSADELHDVLRRVGDLTFDEADLRCEGPDSAGASGSTLLDAGAPGGRSAHRRRGTVRRRRRRRPVSRRARLRAPGRAAGGVHRSGPPTARGAGRPVRPHARPVPRARGRPGGSVPRSSGSSARSHALEADGPDRAGGVPARRGRARVVRRRRAPPAAPAVAGHAAPRGRAGRAGRVGPVPARRGTASRPSGAGSRRWSSRSRRCRVRRSSARRSRARCCRPGCSATAAPTSTSCARAAIWSGSAPAASVPATAGCGCTSPTSWRCSPPPWDTAIPPDGPSHEALRAHLAERGASFWQQLRARGAGRRRRRGPRRALGPRVGR